MRLVKLYGPDDFKLERVPVPTPAAGEVLLRVMVCGICGSDLGYVARGGLLGPSAQPMPLGHELSAVIEAVGEGVAELHPGMRVTVNPMAADNMIGNGGPEGGFGDYLLVRNVAAGGVLLPLPDAVSFHRAALTEPLAVSLHAVNIGAPVAGERAAVFGVGPIGLGIVALLSRRGVRDIVAVDFSAARRELALQLGAVAALAPGDGEPWETLRHHHGEQTFFAQQVPNTELFFDAAGKAQVVQSIVGGAPPGSRLVIAGLHSEPVPLDLITVLMKDFRLQGSMGYPGDEFHAALELLADPTFDTDPLISAHFGLDDFAAAFTAASDPEHGAKIMVEIGV